VNNVGVRRLDGRLRKRDLRMKARLFFMNVLIANFAGNKTLDVRGIILILKDFFVIVEVVILLCCGINVQFVDHCCPSSLF